MSRVATPVLFTLALVTELQRFRAATAASQGLPVYCVLSDTVLQYIARAKPASLQDLRGVRGMTDAKCRLYGQELLQIVAREARQPAVHVKRRSGDQVYILELAQGRVYVGRTHDLTRRMREHSQGLGSSFTRLFPPTGVLLPRLGRVTGSGEAAERDETLRYMFLRGLPLVRGWKYTRPELSEADAADAESNIRELFDLCRRCGHPGHFVDKCRNHYDRLGRPC